MSEPIVEGGYLKVKKKLWKGVLRDKSTEAIIWTCSHNHSRPEFNARYLSDPEDVNLSPGGSWGQLLSSNIPRWEVWETSALNCGRAAYRQRVAGEKVVGDIGLVGSEESELDPEHRLDTRFVRVGDTQFAGTVRLNDNGHRVIELRLFDQPEQPRAALNIDVAKKKGLTLPTDLDSELLGKAVTALWYLKGSVFGVAFQHHRSRLKLEEIENQAIEDLLVDKRTKSTGTYLKLPSLQPKKESSGRSYEPGPRPRIEISERQGARLYDIVSVDGEVVDTFRRRGDAAEKLRVMR